MIPNAVWRKVLQALVLFGWSTAPHTEVAGANATTERAIEEVVAVGIDRCGPWPISHVSSIRGCEYAVLKQRELADVRTSRQRHAGVCLVCANGVCRPRKWRSDVVSQRQTRRVCERLFLTPRTIGSVPTIENGFYTSRAVYVDFTYTITRDGSVEDIKVSAHQRSEMSGRRLLGLLRRGARPVQFEPLKINGVKWKIVDVPDRYRLDGI